MGLILEKECGRVFGCAGVGSVTWYSVVGGARERGVGGGSGKYSTSYRSQY